MKSSLLFLGFFLVGNSHAALSLKESFESARLNMESIKRAEATVTVSHEQENRARAIILPNISGVGSYTRIDTPETVGNSPSPFLLTKQYSAAVRLTQPLLRGGSVSAFQLAKENVLLAKFQKDATEINLYQLVIAAYYNLNIAQVDKKNVEELLKYSRERVSEIRERTKIGKSRRGELIEAEAQLLTAESQFQQTVITLHQAERNFEFYTRMKPDDVGALPDLPQVSGTVEEYMLKVRTRPDVMAFQQQTRVAERQINIAKGSHLPSVDLTSNYYFDRTGVLATSKWDVGVAVVVPLFQGGGPQAAVREAVEVKRIAELNSSEKLRIAERDIAINFQNLQQLQVQIKSLHQALAKAEEAYRLNRKDYQLGLVTNLDVLQSLNIFIETKRSYNSLVGIAHLNNKNLEASTGVLP
jgi:outer membrane protein